MKTDRKRIIIPDFMILFYVLNKLKKASITELHYESKISYAHVFNLKNAFIDKGWVTVEKEGVSSMLSLTESGIEIANGVIYLLEKMDISDDNIKKYSSLSKLKKDDEVVEELIKDDVLKVENSEVIDGRENKQA